MQTEVGGDVNHRHVRSAELADELRGCAVWIGDQGGVVSGSLLEIELLQLDRDAVARVEAIEPRTGLAARGGRSELEARVPPDQVRGERAGIAGRAGNQYSHFTHGATRRSPRARP